MAGLGGPGELEEAGPEVFLPPQTKWKKAELGLGWGCPLSSGELQSGCWSRLRGERARRQCGEGLSPPVHPNNSAKSLETHIARQFCIQVDKAILYTG